MHIICDYSKSENSKSFVPTKKNELSDCITKDNDSLLILPTNVDKSTQCFSETSISKYYNITKYY